MLSGEIRNQVDGIWNAFWSGGIANPLEVMEQITYLLFLRRLDDLHTLEENKARTLKKPIQNPVFPVGKDPKKRPYEDLRWSRFKNMAPAAPLEAQLEFMLRLRLIDSLREKFTRSLSKSDELFASLQHRAFNGTL